MEAHLSSGAVAAISEGRATAAGAQLVLQVFCVSRLQWPAVERFSVCLSDGTHLIMGTLPKSVNHLARDGRRGAVLRLLEFALRAVGSDRVIEIEQLKVLQTDCLMVGNPKQYRSVHLEDKHDRSCVESVTKFTKMDSGAYSAGQGLKAYLTRGMVAMLQQPVVQVVGVSPMRSELEKFEMYHLILSDGVHTQHATLAVHLNHLVKNSNLRKGTIVRLLEFMCNIIQSPSMIIVIQLEVLEKESELIGSPKAYQLRCEKPSERAETYATQAAGYANPNSGPYPSGQGLKWHLTQGAVAAMLEGEMAVEQRPVMQVVDIQGMRHEGLSFYSLVLSDGVHQVKTDLFPHLSHLVTDNYLRRGAIVRLLKFMCDTFISDILNQYQNCRFTVAVELEVLETESKLIGSPLFYQLRNKKKGLDSNHAAYALVNDPAHSAGGSHPNGQGIKGHLTRGAVVAMLEGKMTAEQQPVMQFVAVIPFRNEKYRHILLSDGVYKMSALLWSNLHLVDDNCIRSGTIVRILKFELHTLKNHKIIIVKELEVLQMECELIGRPMLYQLVNKQKDLVADHAAYVPAGNALQSNGDSHPRYKATPG
ncbi:hypothetical protein ACP70R_014933 [Stipagrostis hirtigluma subsp. patula]